MGKLCVGFIGKVFVGKVFVGKVFVGKVYIGIVNMGNLYGLKVLFCWGVAANKEQSLNKILIFVHQNYQFSSPKLSARVVAKTDEWILTRLTGKKLKENLFYK